MAYKVFTNGSPLPASDLNTFLMNQSVMVFANSTARSAALTSPTEGMVTYLEDTNKLEVYTGAAWVDVNDNAAAIPKSTVTTAGDLIVADGNASVTRLGIGANGSIPRVASGALGYLPVGTNGQVLTVSGGAPTWTTPAAGGTKNWTQVTSVDLATAGVTTSLVISSLSGYDNYQLLFDGVSFVADSNLFVRINSSSSGAYNYYGYRFSDTSSYTTSTIRNYRSTGDTRFYLGYAAAGGAVVNGGINISGANTSGQKVVDVVTMGGTTTDSEGFIYQGRFDAPFAGITTITSLEIYTDISNFDAGIVTLLGA
jgi:hypothetical protein